MESKTKELIEALRWKNPLNPNLNSINGQPAEIVLRSDLEDAADELERLAALEAQSPAEGDLSALPPIPLLETSPPPPNVFRALSWLLDYTDANTCRHETTHRGGLIWTVCDDCEQRWADDNGGFIPYEDAGAVANARAVRDAVMTPQGQSLGGSEPKSQFPAVGGGDWLKSLRTYASMLHAADKHGIDRDFDDLEVEDQVNYLNMAAAVLNDVRASMKDAPTHLRGASSVGLGEGSSVLLSPHPDHAGAEIATPVDLQWSGQFSVNDPDPADDHSAIYLQCPNGLLVDFSSDPTPDLDVARVHWIATKLNAALSSPLTHAGEGAKDYDTPMWLALCQIFSATKNAAALLRTKPVNQTSVDLILSALDRVAKDADDAINAVAPIPVHEGAILDAAENLLIAIGMGWELDGCASVLQEAIAGHHQASVCESDIPEIIERGERGEKLSACQQSAWSGYELGWRDGRKDAALSPGGCSNCGGARSQAGRRVVWPAPSRT